MTNIKLHFFLVKETLNKTLISWWKELIYSVNHPRYDVFLLGIVILEIIKRKWSCIASIETLIMISLEDLNKTPYSF